MPDVAVWTAFATGLRNVGLDLLANADIKVTEERDPRIVGLLLLSRTLSNLQGALILLQHNQIVEARILARCCYENHFWMIGLVHDGTRFMDKMVHDAMKHKTARVQTIFETRAELDGDTENKLRMWLRENEKWSKSKTLHPKGVAGTLSEKAYIFYEMLSLDAHPSIDTLNRHFVEPGADGVPEIDVEPAPRPTEIVETLNVLCLPVIGVFLSVSELLGNATQPPAISEAAEEYRRLTEKTGALKDSP